MIKVGQTVPKEIIQAVYCCVTVHQRCSEKTTEGRVRWSVYYSSSALVSFVT